MKFANLVSAILALCATLPTLAAEEFIAGADFSHLKFFEDRGIVYKTGGQPQDALAILKSNGLNCVRLRLFTSSTAQATSDPYNYTNNLAYNLPLAVRVKNAGLKFLLDFHYSDSWADPGKQTKPAAWTNLNFTQLVQQVYDYNSNTIAAFAAAGAMPDYVQVGNEIISGMLWNDGRVGGGFDTPTQWSKLAQLMTNAIRGIKDAAGTNPPPKIIVHIDRGGDWAGTQWFFDNLTNRNVAFDIIGESYYPWWHGDLSALSNCLNNAAQRYSKPVIVAETAFPWTNDIPYNPNLGIPLTPEGQVQYTLALASIVKGVSGGKGAGIFWWGTEYVQLSGYNLADFQKTSFFDYQGNLLSVASAFGQLSAPAAVTLYTQNWGSPSTAVQTANSLGLVGWTVIANRQGGVGPYYGIFPAGGANDPTLGLGLPINTVYFTGLTGTNQLGGPGMFYTVTESNVFSVGTNVFTAIDPTLHTNLTFNLEVRNDGGNNPNYFAVRVGGSWYVNTNSPAPLVNVGTYPAFTNWTMVYNTNAAGWNNLTLGSTFVTIGLPAAANLTGPITGIGIVELTNTPPGVVNNGFTYNQLVINQGPGDFPSSPPTLVIPAVSPQTVYVGGGASFLTAWAGAPTLTFRWQTNGVNLNSAGRIFGATSDALTITNVNTGDGVSVFSVFVTNFFGRATNGGLYLVINTVPAGVLYAETFPYVGPSGDIPITGVGWVGVFQGNTGIYTSGPGIGNVFSYSPVATTNIYFTTVTNDIGTSGLRFVTINPEAYPNVTFQANFTPGNAASLNPTNVVAYWAVQMTNGNWYSSVKRIPVQTITLNNYQQYQMAFSRVATNWNTLTINGTTDASIGSVAGGNLAGNIIGAGVVIAHLGVNIGADDGGDFNFNSFVLTTNAATVLPPTIGVNGSPWSQEVASGGGVSFGVSATGAEPFTYGWKLNGVSLTNGGRISGATSPVLTIANLTTNDTANAIVSVIAYVTNSAGFDRSDIYVNTTLTVTNPSVGLLYQESFPFIGPLGGPGNNYPISSAGWVEAVAGVPNALYQNIGSDGAVFAFRGGTDTTAYYATTASDTNQAGLRLPNINLAFYPSLNISVDLAPQFSASNVTAYLAIQVGTNWHVAASPLPVPTATDSGTFSTYSTVFSPVAANWKNLTITGSGAIIGSTASGNLSGTMTGAGLVFVTVGTGGTFNFDNFMITGTGVGGINVGPLAAGSINFSWVGNPAVNLQSTTNLPSNWQDVSNSFGVYSLSVSATNPARFFRLKGP